MLLNNSFVSKEVQERALAVKEKLRAQEVELENKSRELEISLRVETLAELERQFGIASDH